MKTFIIIASLAACFITALGKSSEPMPGDPNTICCENSGHNIGCFIKHDRNYSAYGYDPICPSESHPVTYRRFTRSNLKLGTKLKLGQTPVTMLPCLKSEKKFIIVDSYPLIQSEALENVGFTFDDDWRDTMKDKLLEVMDADVIIVDWESLRQFSERVYYYHRHPANVQPIGIHLGKVLEPFGRCLSSFTCIGFGLGAHVCGEAGDYLRTNGHKLGRIIGLSPAEAGFERLRDFHKPGTFGLNKNSARLVDVIHTDMHGLGTTLDRGHMDFRVNGGTTQLGCNKQLDSVGCSHHRAIQFFIESITDKRCFAAEPILFTEVPDGIVVRMGLGASRNVIAGTYSVLADEENPYCTKNALKGLKCCMDRSNVNIGCFDDSGAYNVVPQCPEEAGGMTYAIYTQSNHDSSEIYRIWDNPSDLQHFNSTKGAFFFVDTISSDMRSWVLRAKNQLLDVWDANVIIVNWSSLYHITDENDEDGYKKTAANTRTVGAHIAKSMKLLHLERVLCIGFDLGAHVCGEAGTYLKKAPYAQKMNTIIGLDPARRGFDRYIRQTELGLLKYMATFVNVIHTDAGSGGMGTQRARGKTDFYVNGYSDSQPGCDDEETPGCSHDRATEYFVTSITNPRCFVPENHPGFDDPAGAKIAFEMVPPKGFGKWYIEPSTEAPYCSVTVNEK